MSAKTYSELIKFPTFAERFEYLKLHGELGDLTYGKDRYLNQVLYNSEEWRRCRRLIVIRDKGQDLGCEGFTIQGRILIHHIEPITVDDILNRSQRVFDPENLICVSHDTHNALHFGKKNYLGGELIERTKNDTCPWKR